MQNKLHKLQTELSSAFQHLKQGTDANIVIKRLSQLLRKWPNQPDIVHLLALAYKQAGDFSNAEKKFKLALSVDSKNTQIHNNLANLYKENEAFAKAIEHYQFALSLQPNFTDAKRNLGLCYYQMKEYLTSIEVFKSLLSKVDDVASRNALANSLRENGNYREAESQYSAVLHSNPDYVKAWHNRGANHHLNGSSELAAQCYQKALMIDPQLEESAVSLSMLYKESDDLTRAIKVLENALAHNSNSAKLVSTLNEFHWEAGRKDQFKRNASAYLDKNSSHADMQVALIGQLIKAGHFDQASYYTDRAIDTLGGIPSLMMYRGQLLAEQSEHSQAFTCFEDALNRTFSRAMAIEQIKLALILERYEQAQFYLAKLTEVSAPCQLSWALQSLVWRFTNPSKYHWLNQGYDFVKSYQIQTPIGYSNLGDYLAELSHLLDRLHQTKAAPLEQTLRNGTQTAAKILDRSDSLIKKLRSSIEGIVRDYIDSLQGDDRHPFLSRKTSNFEISGSWSVRLRANGFHVNHVHPAGWISSSSYIHLPTSSASSMHQDEGAIKFGESPLSLRDREVTEKVIQPTAGMVVLFPSYTWHGTIPFGSSCDAEEQQTRLTAPFDVLPV